MNHSYQILIVEDEQRIREELSAYLMSVGYRTETITDFTQTLSLIKQSSADLILLDINLPGLDGYSLCHAIRKEMDIPIIIVTSRDNAIDELMSMNLGADDFVTKPYNLPILLARMESVLRRTYVSKQSNKYLYGDLELDLLKGSVSYHEESMILTKNELKILHYLMQNKGKIISREQLMEYLWSSANFIDDNTLSVNINRLRKKIEELGMSNPIKTRRGLGYIMP